MNNLVVISGITVSILVIILLFKLNKTKIEYDNKLLVLNRKVRDITNLVDLNNTKNNLINSGDNTQPKLENVNLLNDTSKPVNDAQNNTGIDTQYHNFVQNNGNFFDNLDNFDSPLSEDIKNDIDNLVNQELVTEELDTNVTPVLSEDTVPPVSSNYEEEVSNNETVESVLAMQNSEEVVNNNIEEIVEDTIQFSLQNLETNDNELEVNELEFNENNLDDNVLNVELNETNFEAENVTEITLETNEETDKVEPEVAEAEVALNEVKLPTDDRNLEGSANTNVNFNDLENMSVKSLQDICREYKLKIKGRKDELIDRIKDYLSVDKL